MCDIMNLFASIIDGIQPYIGIINVIIIIVIASLIFTVILKLIKRHLLKKVRRKKQVSNVVLFLDLLKYLFIFFLIIIVFSAYYNKWGELGFIAGLLTVALGWALQKPISGVVAWLIIITRRPFFIGDRIIISGIKGDISDITLTHIFLDEVGGTILGEEKSRRTIMVPTSIIFEEEVVNYTHNDNYILDEITTAITYESNLKKAETLVIKAVEKIMKPLWEKFPKKIIKEPHIRLKFKDSGIDVTVRYNTSADKRNEISTNITREIFQQISNTGDVEIAYPHTEVVFREKKLQKK
jgi:small-conductance mechanosensitive channel